MLPCPDAIQINNVFLRSVYLSSSFFLYDYSPNSSSPRFPLYTLTSPIQFFACIYKFVCLFECINLAMYSAVRLLVLFNKEYSYLLTYCITMVHVAHWSKNVINHYHLLDLSQSFKLNDFTMVV